METAIEFHSFIKCLGKIFNLLRHPYYPQCNGFCDDRGVNVERLWRLKRTEDPVKKRRIEGWFVLLVTIYKIVAIYEGVHTMGIFKTLKELQTLVTSNAPMKDAN